jgi:hypothetical protein
MPEPTFSNLREKARYGEIAAVLVPANDAEHGVIHYLAAILSDLEAGLLLDMVRRAVRRVLGGDPK